MNNSENKELLVNYGHGVIVLPEAVMGVVSSAKKNDIIVLLALLSDKDASTASVAEKFAMSEEAVERAIAFWRGAGIITYGEEKKSEPAAETKEEKKTAKKGRRGDLGSLPEYSSNEIAEMVENDRDVALMIDECERALGKIFRVGETAKILALRDYLGFSPEYISTLCEYCAGIGKTSVQEHLGILEKRKIIEKSKHGNLNGRRNNVYTLLSLDNPEVYRDLTPKEELPLFVGEELPL